MDIEPITVLEAAGIGFARVSGIVSLVPLPGLQSANPIARIVLALAITVVLVPCWIRLVIPAPGVSGIIWILSSEAALGITIGLAVLSLSEVFITAGQIMNIQAGFTYATTIDPTNQTDSGIVPMLWQLFGAVVALGLGVDRAVFRVIGESFQTCPPGTWIASIQSVGGIASFSGQMLSLGFRMALPVVTCLVLIDLLLASVTRVSSAIQLLSLSFPVKILASLLLFSISLPVSATLFQGACEKFGHLLQSLLVAVH